jgi:hypothetical protein
LVLKRDRWREGKPDRPEGRRTGEKLLLFPKTLTVTGEWVDSHRGGRARRKTHVLNL